MTDQQKLGKCKNLTRSSREKVRNAMERSAKVARARYRHLVNAERSCGKAFADKLRIYYAKNFQPGKKA